MITAERDRWRQAADLFDRVVELPAAERAVFLERACPDAELRAEVASLLHAEENPAGLLGAAALAAPLRGAVLLSRERPVGGDDEAPGALFGAYRLLRPLGRGGMGTVFLAERADGAFEQQVALKLVRGDAAADELRQRFIQERQILAGLRHPNIAGLLDGGIAPDGRPYFALEYVEGEAIHTWCARRRLPLGERLRLFLDVCAAVQAAHERRIVHRDLKPSNVLVTAEGRVKLLDFGIAKLLDDTEAAAARAQLTRTGMRLLTPGYAAPEQHRGGTITPATDVYALGVLLAELLTGRRPPDATSGAHSDDARPTTDPLGATAESAAALGITVGELRRRLRGDLDAIVRTALREEPGRRYANAGALGGDVRAFLEGRPVTARRDSLAYRSGRLWRRRRAVVIAAMLGAVALALAGAAWWSAVDARTARASAAPRAFHLVSTTPGQHRSPTLSPDGKSVAYVDFTIGVPQLWVKDLPDGVPRQLTTGAAAVARPRWSPRGDRIAFGRNRQGIWVISPAGGEPRQVIKAGYSPSFSSDGRQLVFERSGGKILLADANGGNEHELEGVPESQFILFNDLAPTLSPDGRSIAFFRCEHGPTGDLWVMSSAGGGARRLTHDLREGGEPIWTPDGKSIIFSSARGGSRTLWRVPAAGGTPLPVTTGSGEDTDPSLDSSGRQLVYTNARNNYVLTILDPESGSERSVLEQRHGIYFPEVSPDGTRIASFIQTENGFHLFSAGIDGTGFRLVTTDPGEFNTFPHWSGDGRALYYFQYLPKPGLRRVSAVGGESVEVQAAWGIHSGARVDPSDRAVAYSEGAPWRPTMTRVRELANGRERPIARPLLGMTWHRDGSEIAAYTWERDVVVCATADGNCRTLATKGHTPVWSPDGATVYFLRGPDRLDDPTIGRVGVFAVGRDGSGERHLADLAPIVNHGKSLGVTADDRILWVKYARGPHQIWLADLP